MTKAYKHLEDKIISLFNENCQIRWNNESYNNVLACKPRPQRGGGECKTDVYVLLNNTINGKVTEIKISVKKDDAEFLANKLTALVAEDLFGQDWKQILIANIDPIKDKFINEKSRLAREKMSSGTTDANFTLGWKLEVANKKRTLSTPLKLTNDEIIKIIFKGENQVTEKRNAVALDNKPCENSGIAEYLINGNIDKYSNAQDVIDDLRYLDNYNAGEVHLVFTANNFRYNANKADGARTLAVAVKWSVKDGRLSPEIIFDEPLTYQGERDMMPHIKDSLAYLGIKNYSDIDMEEIKPN